jgi:hypothetical protein
VGTGDGVGWHYESHGFLAGLGVGRESDGTIVGVEPGTGVGLGAETG